MGQGAKALKSLKLRMGSKLQRRTQAGREQQKQKPSARKVASVQGTLCGWRGGCWVTGQTVQDLRAQRKTSAFTSKEHVRDRAALRLSWGPSTFPVFVITHS